MDDFGGSFKATVLYDPYFLIATKKGAEAEVEEWLRRKFEGLVKKTSRVAKEDLRMPNHLLGYRRTFVKLEFTNVADLLAVRKVLMPIAAKNKKNVDVMDTYVEVVKYVPKVVLADWIYFGADNKIVVLMRLMTFWAMAIMIHERRRVCLMLVITS